jgi:PAS domain S-box-containing protein
MSRDLALPESLSGTPELLGESAASFTVGVGSEGSDLGRWSPLEAEALLSELASVFALMAETPATPATGSEPSRTTVKLGGEAEPATSEMARSALLAVDAAGIVRGTGGDAELLFELPAAELEGRPLSGLLSPLPGRRAPWPFPAAATTSVEALGRRRAGATFPVAVQLAPLSIGNARHTVLIVQDLTESRRAAERRRQVATRYQALVEQIPAVTFMAALDEGANEIYIGPQIEALLGFSQKEWLDDPVLWFKRLHPDDQERWNAEFTRGVATGGPFRADCRFLAKDGRTVWVHGEARLVRDSEGRPLCIQGVAFDITDIKAAEEKMREAQDALVRNERLAALGQLAASVGHELRNPLGAVRNAWHYVEKQLGPQISAHPRLPAFSEVIRTELARCARIIGELLDFARQRPLFRVAAPLAQLVQESLGLVARPAATIQFLDEVPIDLPVPYVDRDQFKQVLVNLLQNAAEAVDPATGVVRVRAASDDDQLTLTIEDNGRGMSPEVLEKIFDPLFTTKLRGTGLGLAIAAGVIKRHQGTIRVHSVPGHGSTFTLAFPVGEPSSELPPDLGGAADLR